MNGFVYAIGDGHQVKIGWSTNPLRRLGAIRTGCPVDATLLGIVAATRAQEREVQTLMDPWRIRAEWFRLEGPVVAFVGMLSKPVPRVAYSRTVSNGDRPLRIWRKENGLRLIEAASEIGTTAPHLCKIELGQRIPSAPLLARILDITGLAAQQVLCVASEPRSQVA